MPAGGARALLPCPPMGEPLLPQHDLPLPVLGCLVGAAVGTGLVLLSLRHPAEGRPMDFWVSSRVPAKATPTLGLQGRHLTKVPHTRLVEARPPAQSLRAGALNARRIGADAIPWGPLACAASLAACVATLLRMSGRPSKAVPWRMMSTMEAEVEHPPAPWRYTGRSYLQLSFMDAAVAKANLPPGLVLDSSLERFGKTYGGFFLAEYDNTPFGSFWELVVICGLVWNREPTLKDVILGLFTAPSSERDVGKEENSRSTWASHVFVSSRAARDHGRSIFGLLSNDAQFTVTDAEDSPEGQPRQRVVIRRGLEGDGGEVATVVIPKRGRNKSKLPPEGFGPLNLSLPSLSGCSEYVKELLHYSVDLTCKTSLVFPACKVTVPAGSPVEGIMGLDPLICVNFDDMTMDVPEPLPYS
eukprot:EG_transcript_11554